MNNNIIDSSKITSNFKVVLIQYTTHTKKFTIIDATVSIGCAITYTTTTKSHNIVYTHIHTYNTSIQHTTNKTQWIRHNNSTKYYSQYSTQYDAQY